MLVGITPLITGCVHCWEMLLIVVNASFSKFSPMAIDIARGQK
jgi:hypothetical protein